MTSRRQTRHTEGVGNVSTALVSPPSGAATGFPLRETAPPIPYGRSSRLGTDGLPREDATATSRSSSPSARSRYPAARGYTRCLKHSGDPRTTRYMRAAGLNGELRDKAVGAKRVGWIIRVLHEARNDAMLLGPSHDGVAHPVAACEGPCLLGRLPEAFSAALGLYRQRGRTGARR